MTEQTVIPESAKGVSLRNGYWYYFNDGDIRITVFASALSGREAVFVNDDVVSVKRKFGFRSAHEFRHGASTYSVSITVSKMATAEITCALSKDGQPLATTSKAVFRGRRHFWTLVAIGAVAGALGAWAGRSLSFFN
jgi:hypothetical protein